MRNLKSAAVVAALFLLAACGEASSKTQGAAQHPRNVLNCD
jgi:hypothetical protein